jgi:sugar phosphate isomerase/epimerase
LWLSYCTNVHATDSLEALEASVAKLWRAVRERLGLGCALGVGLWLPASLVRTLHAAPARIEHLRAFLDDHGLVCVSLNAFPFGDFHAERVKEAVYRPAWYERERLVYTVQAAEVLARLLPDGVDRGTRSTVPLAWREHAQEDGGVAHLAGAVLLEAAGLCAEIELRTGKRIQVLLEPEPGCVLETTPQVEQFLLELCRGHRKSAAFDRHLGVCFDCCHQAVMGEDTGRALARLHQSGVSVGKVHLSSAIEGPLEALAPYAEPRYLHQTVAVDGSARAHDLGAALADPALAGRRVRTHFHVPVHIGRLGGGLETTRATLAPALDEVLGWAEPPHLEVETYTWDVLPEPPSTLAEGIAAELAYVLGLLRERGYDVG